MWLYWFFLSSFCYCWTASFWEKTSCMIQQCFQSCCIYALWILCDCTVLYLSITGNYMVLYVCHGLHTLRHSQTHRIPYNQSNIVTNWFKCTLTGLVLSTCVLCTVFHYSVTMHPWKGISELLSKQVLRVFLSFFFIYINRSALNELLSSFCLKDC